jgi:hypothetical protein
VNHILWRVGVATSLLLFLVACSQGPSTGPAASVVAASADHQSFATPEAAVEALVAALRAGDRDGMAKLMGPGTEALLDSGDPVENDRERQAFLSGYDAFHQLLAGSQNELVLVIGDDRWPLPVPLVRNEDRWGWDGAAGAQEIVVRRIGADELHTIDVMHGFVAAQHDYAAGAHDGNPAGSFARQVKSTPGKHDGLYWDVVPGAPPSPAGPLLAAASAAGYNGADPGRQPYHGYLFKLLNAQGADASGGAKNYLVDGKLTGGFAVLAYPASYGASGVMTFLVNQDGVVWQRDLGATTAEVAATITEFNPDRNWTPIAEDEG